MDNKTNLEFSFKYDIILFYGILFLIYDIVYHIEYCKIIYNIISNMTLNYIYYLLKYSSLVL